jgi:hypothetical protein
LYACRREQKDNKMEENLRLRYLCRPVVAMLRRRRKVSWFRSSRLCGCRHREHQGSE